MRITYAIWLFLFFSCKNKSVGSHQQQTSPSAGNPSINVLSTDNALKFSNGFCYYKGILFSGRINELFPSKKLKSTQTFLNGKEEGFLQTYYPDGMQETKRYYHLGEKDSVHIGWWPNGNKRFEIRFSGGAYNGDYQEWYADGNPLMHIIYNHGNDISGRAWRNNGKLYLNFINKDGRRYGLLNSQLCYSLKNEKGEFVESTSDILK